MINGEQSRKDLDKRATELFKGVLKKADRRHLYDQMYNKFGLPHQVAEEMVTFRRNIMEFTTFEVFCMMWFLDRNSLSKYFTKEEINFLSNEKYETEQKENFPIIFTNLVEVTPDQWIGTISVKKLMALKESRLINYEEGEQRPLQRMKSGNVEVWKPFVNKRNIEEIKALMESGQYIPDPITLNMPEGAEFNFDNGTMTVYSLPKGMFNLDDGWHRYLAISRIYEFNKDFDFTMEFRLVNFGSTKASNFIFQQDQKVHMTKIVSDSYNMNAIATKIVQRLNQDGNCNIQGMIGLGDYAINAAQLGKLVNYFFVDKNVNKQSEMSYVIKTKNELAKKFNAVTEQNEIFLGKYSDVLLFVTMYIFSTDTPKSKYAKVILDIVNSIPADEIKLFTIPANGNVRRKPIKIIEERRDE